MRTGREVSIFVHRGEQVLLLRRTRDGIWHIPAGGVDEGESSHDAARRELEEEAGLRASAVEALGHVCRYPIMADDRRTYSPGVVEVTHEAFAVAAPSGWEPRLDAEHTEHTEQRWVSFEEARRTFHWEETREAFDILRGRLAQRPPRSTSAAARLRAFRPGDEIVHRSVDTEARIVLSVLPQRVVRDDPDVIAAYTPSGSVTKRRTGDRSGGPRGRQLVHWDGGHADRPWTGASVLMVHRPGDGYSLWTAWRVEDGEHAWSYINLEEPWRRTAVGFDSRDLWLDLYRKPDEQEWHWKDEDELAWAAEHGQCTPERAGAIRAEGERALAVFGRGEPPFDRDWSAWRPDPSWPVPRLPEGWEEP